VADTLPIGDVGNLLRYRTLDEAVSLDVRDGSDWDAYLSRPFGSRPGLLSGFDAWWSSYLAGTQAQSVKRRGGPTINFVDLFSSVGGLSQGFMQAAAALGRRTVPLAAVDNDKDALEVYRHNHSPNRTVPKSVTDLVDFALDFSHDTPKFRRPPTFTSPQAASIFDNVTVLLAGPPCQGHSTLNNKSRGDDPRNLLYLAVPALAIATSAPLVIIENVANVVNDRYGVVKAAHGMLKNHGYYVTDGLVDVSKLGWPQTRKRFFMIASSRPLSTNLSAFLRDHAQTTRPVSWALNDLNGLANTDVDDMFNSSSQLSADNQKRVQWLFESDERRDLPDELRPVCHQNGHTYPAVYGRMDSDKPSGTITGGFLSPGRGRFIHPNEPRGLTPHEGARIQGFSDAFDFVINERVKRTQLAQWIGNAVPPPMAFYVSMLALTGLLADDANA
jgi:DNA (cytosine-5)-methyltransferase 1